MKDPAETQAAALKIPLPFATWLGHTVVLPVTLVKCKIPTALSSGSHSTIPNSTRKVHVLEHVPEMSVGKPLIYSMSTNPRYNSTFPIQ